MIETVVVEREEYFNTLYSEITHWLRIEGMIPLVSFLPQIVLRWGNRLSGHLEKGEIWNKDELTFGLGLVRAGSGMRLNFGATRYSPQELDIRTLSGLVDRSATLMAGEFHSAYPGDWVDVNCWANSRIYGGHNLDGSNPYSLVSVVERTIKQGRY